MKKIVVQYMDICIKNFFLTHEFIKFNTSSNFNAIRKITNLYLISTKSHIMKKKSDF